MAYAYSRPAPGTLTRRVWDIADEETQRSGQLAKRQQVIERAMAEGANQNTASTQYHHWRKHAAAAPQAGELSPAAAASSYLSLDVREAGRVLLPADVRIALGVREGDELVGELVDGELRLMSRDTALRKAQELVRKYVPEGVSLVDELIAERRAESRREEADASGAQTR